MTGIDWLLLAIVALSALLGLWRGMIGVLASLAAWILAGWAAFRFGGTVALVLAGDGTPGPGQTLAGYVLAFMVVLVAVGIAGWLVRKLVHSVGLSGLDRLLGLLLGVLRGVLVGWVVVLLLGLTALPRQAGWQHSRVLPVFIPGAAWLRGWLPEWVAQQVDLGAGAQAAPVPTPEGADPAPRISPDGATPAPSDSGEVPGPTTAAVAA